MAKFLIAGPTGPQSLLTTLSRELVAAGHQTAEYDDYKLFEAVERGGSSAIMKKWHYFQARREANAGLIAAVESSAPDVLLVIKGEQIKPATLRALKQQKNLLIANWNPDNPLHPSHTTPYVESAIPEYDLYVIWGKFLVPKLKERGAKAVEHIPFGFDPVLHPQVSISADEAKKFGADLTFVGTWDPDRERQLEPLTKGPWSLKIWGNHWSKLSPSSSLRSCIQGDALYGRDFVKICLSAKIVLNFIRPMNVPAMNMRTFEVMGCGGFLLSTYAAEQSEMFEEGVDFASFTSVENLFEQARHYLGDDEARRKIAAAGRMKVISQHTYRHRVEAFLRRLPLQ